MPTASSGLTLTYPSSGERNWYQTFKTLVEAISAHDHSGGGKGVQITVGSLGANSVGAAAIRLANDTYLRARNAGNSADINVIKIGALDKVIFDATAVDGTTRTSLGLGTGASVTFTGLTLSSLTASQFVKTDGSKALVSSTIAQADVSGLTTASSPTLAGLTLSGLTASQWVKTDGSKALVSSTLAQADVSGLTTASSPTFAGITLSGLTASRYVMSDGSKALVSKTATEVIDDILDDASEGKTSWVTEMTPSSFTFTGGSSGYQRAMKVGKRCLLAWEIQGTVSGAHADNETLQVTLPYASADIGTQVIPIFISASGDFAGVLSITTNSTIGLIKKIGSAPNRIADGAAYFWIHGNYVIA